jgi:hypothetical protein
MNDKEKMEFYIAMCKCCLLAEAMKNCPLCQFNIGLAEQVKLGEAIPFQMLEPTAMFAVSG